MNQVNTQVRDRALPAFRVIAQELEQQVLCGELAVGSVLPGELSLADRFNVSRSTIREAIRLLEQIGLIRREEGRNKLTVTAPSHEDIGDRIRTTFLLQDTTFEQLWEVMSAIEPMCASVAAIKATESDLELIADNLARTEAALDDPEQLVELDIEFHNLVAAATGNSALKLSRDTVGEFFYPAFNVVMTRLNAGARLLLAHRKITEALGARNAAEAKSWMEKHIGDFQRGCELANLDFTAPIRGAMIELR
jgi:GntR family transcriptional repressor for pyruvate dehydrogenase complex